MEGTVGRRPPAMDDGFGGVGLVGGGGMVVVDEFGRDVRDN